ncbi:MAG: diaminopimelate epimerase [Actinomycetota bacterium]
MQLNFSKYEGIGNDFIIINNLDGSISLSKEQIGKLCHRNFGVGADGLILARPSKVADFFMDFYNSDGSIAEMCGNGIRCFAKYIADEGLSNKSTLNIETRAGVKTVDLLIDGGKVVGARVDMGEPVLDTQKIPVKYEANQLINQPISIDEPSQIDGALKVGGASSSSFYATCVSMGNPHCVIFVDDIRTAPVQSLGPKIETSSYFPQKTNVEFAHVVASDEIELRVWERGCGETMACGTGACASLVACVLNGKTERSATVHLPGGNLRISWDKKTNHVFLEGPAAKVFFGTIEIDDGS